VNGERDALPGRTQAHADDFARRPAFAASDMWTFWPACGTGGVSDSVPP
jgi:hypothetical protein